jgi:hypothetical protein
MNAFAQLQPQEKKSALDSLDADQDLYWEAVGPDGILYQFNDSVFDQNGNVKSKHERKALSKKRAAHDAEIHKKMIAAIRSSNDAELGKMFREQAINYANYLMSME